MYVELDRSFRALADDATAKHSDEAQLFPTAKSLSWPELLQLPRVVILSEAGAGKTEEIRRAAWKLRGDGKDAFFLRLERIPDGFEEAFEEGTFSEFQAWLGSSREGWLLLDSIDEARLRAPQDFERAVRAIGRHLQPAAQRVRIILTGRTAAWRPLSDLALCKKHLPFALSEQAQTTVSGPRDTAARQRRSSSASGDAQDKMFSIVALEDLSAAQVRRFAQAHGVTDVAAMVGEIERSDAWSFTTRPLDLQELLDFWQINRRIASRAELLGASIDRRLREQDLTRDELRPLTPLRARKGARLVAAACTLTRQQTIAVPDSEASARGLQLDALLHDWSAQERSTLLQRPVFDEEIYRTVRFHHRSVREFLTAEWFAGLLQQHTSRNAIEDLFFREQYGFEVVPPELRDVLPWLALLDARIQERTLQVAPEVLLSGGDPSRLLLTTRRRMLDTFCERLANGQPSMHADYVAIQRFAGQDMTPDVRRCLETYGDDESQLLLMQMVWQGRLGGALAQALAVASSVQRPSYLRRAAVRAVRAVGSDADLAALRSSFCAEAGELDRRLLAVLLECAPHSSETMEWLFRCLEKVSANQSFSVDSLSESIGTTLEDIQTSELVRTAERLESLLNEHPVIEHKHCEISKRYAWLLKPAALALRRLITERHPAMLEQPCLTLLHKLPQARSHELLDLSTKKSDLEPLVRAWPALRFALFWHAAEEARQAPDHSTNQDPDWWQVVPWPTYISFHKDDADEALAYVTARPLLADRLLALSLTFRLYVDQRRPRSLLARLKAACRSCEALQHRLNELLHPAPPSAQTIEQRRRHAAWKSRSKARERRAQATRAVWRARVQANVESIRRAALAPHEISQDQYHLHEAMRLLAQERSTWSTGQWRLLAEEFGMDVAIAFRDALAVFWRRYRPQLVSEGAPLNSTPFAVIFGLSGLAVDSTETTQWVDQLTASDADLACRYAVHELNGLPEWFPAVFERYPAAVRDFLLHEVDHELRIATADQDVHYLIHDIHWHARWCWDALAPPLLQRLVAAEPANFRSLKHLLNVVQGSCLDDASVRDLVRARAMASTSEAPMALWHAAWTGVAPDEALPAIRAHLDRLEDAQARTRFVIAYLNELIGGRESADSQIRLAYHTPQHLKTLYLLAHEHVRRTDDINRANGRVYSPGPRDNAQDARELLLSQLRALPGKASFIAITEIAQEHPNHASRPHLQQMAKAMAQADSAGAPWTERQVQEFHDAQERTPRTLVELFDLVVLRILDLRRNLEDGDSSDASMLAQIDSETATRIYIGNWLRQLSRGRYAIPQEEELADAKRPDLRFHAAGVDHPVPVELKLAHRWTGPSLFERLENQLCGDYLRDQRSGHGVFLLVNGERHKRWQLPGSQATVDIHGLVQALQDHWTAVSPRLPHVHQVRVIGIDLTKRSTPR